MSASGEMHSAAATSVEEALSVFSFARNRSEQIGDNLLLLGAIGVVGVVTGTGRKDWPSWSPFESCDGAILPASSSRYGPTCCVY